MRLGIMQPYFFPYIGYFQLINSVDRFVIYDDIAFIKQGWINRNRILAAGKDLMITVPVKDQSSFRLIKDTHIVEDDRWKIKMTKTLSQNYCKAPYFKEVTSLVEEVLATDVSTISQLAFLSIDKVCQYLQIKKDFVIDCSQYDNGHLTGQDRVLDICLQEKTDEYVNASGGADLYSKKAFEEKGVRLLFIQSQKNVYAQFTHDFVPWLSIIDVMMFNSKDIVRQMLGDVLLI